MRGKRVVSNKPLKRKRLDDWNNCVTKLQMREIGRKMSGSSHLRQTFQNFMLQEEFDTCDRSEIRDIYVIRGIIFALTMSGICVAFCRYTNRKLCSLNITPQEVILRTVYNSYNDSVLIVVRNDPNDFISKTCRTTAVENIRRGQPDAGFPAFDTDSSTWRGYICFDRKEGKVIVTYSPDDGICKVFGMKTYKLLYSVTYKNLDYIDIHFGTMMLVFEKPPSGSHVPVKILSKEDGTCLKAFNYKLGGGKLLRIQHLNEVFALIHLQTRTGITKLKIKHVLTGQVTEVRGKDLKRPILFRCLPLQRLFLAVYENGRVGVWNERGELVSSLEDHILWDLDLSNMDCTRDQKVIISYCKGDHPEENVRSININSVLTGKRLAKICSNDPNVCISSRNRSNATLMQIGVVEALENVTKVFYDRETNEIFTGNLRGLVHVWSN